MADSSTVSFTLGPGIMFCPADRPERYLKAFQRADAVIIDLEDAVSVAEKPAARRALHDFLADPEIASQYPDVWERLVVRVNSIDSAHFSADAQAITGLGVRWLMVPKAEGVEELNEITSLFPNVGVIALIETALGVANAVQVAAHPSVVALMWGAEDLIASMGGTTSRFVDNTYRDVAKYARSQVLVAGSAFGKAVIDSINADIHNLELVRAEASDALACGFAAKAAIHPGQIDAIRKAFAPTEEEVLYAQQLLKAVAGATGVTNFRGQMVDGPLIAQAERIIQRAEGS